MENWERETTRAAAVVWLLYVDEFSREKLLIQQMWNEWNGRDDPEMRSESEI